MFREIDIYSNDITLLQNRFSKSIVAYSRRLLQILSLRHCGRGGRLVRSAQLCAPHHRHGDFSEALCAEVRFDNDGQEARAVSPHSINVNFVDGMTLTQTFDRAPDGSRLKTSDDMSMELSILPGMPGLFVRRNTTYSRFNFDAPANEDLAFGHAEYQIVADDAYRRTTTSGAHTAMCRSPARRNHLPLW